MKPTPTAPLMLTAAESLELSSVMGESSAFARRMDEAFADRQRARFDVTAAQLAALRIVAKQTRPIEDYYSPSALLRRIDRTARRMEFNQ